MEYILSKYSNLKCRVRQLEMPGAKLQYLNLQIFFILYFKLKIIINVIYYFKLKMIVNVIYLNVCIVSTLFLLAFSRQMPRPYGSIYLRIRYTLFPYKYRIHNEQHFR